MAGIPNVPDAIWPAHWLYSAYNLTTTVWDESVSCWGQEIEGNRRSQSVIEGKMRGEPALKSNAISLIESSYDIWGQFVLGSRVYSGVRRFWRKDLIPRLSPTCDAPSGMCTTSPTACGTITSGIRQYTGGHNETWGGLTLNIDSDVSEGVVASLHQATVRIYLPLIMQEAEDPPPAE